MAMTASSFMPSRPSASGGTTRLNFDIPDALLTEVDFKWLMAGQGHPVDVARLHGDPAYAREMLGQAMASDFPSLRDCALALAQLLQSPSH